MAAAPSKPEVFEYLDFRAYLRDFLDYLRESDPAFTFAAMAQRHGLASRGHYLDIVNGRRLTPRFVEPYIRICGLEGGRAEYFKALVAYNQARGEREKTAAFEQITALAPQLETVRLEEEAFEYFSKWYQPVMLSLLDVNRSVQDHRELAKLFDPPISAVQARKALAALIDLGYIAWDDAKREWTFLRKFLKCTDEARAVAVKRFHRQVQQLGMQAYEKRFEEQTFSTLTLSVSRETKAEIENMITDLRKHIMEKAKTDQNPQVVVQANFQTFDLSRPKRGRGRPRSTTS